MALSASPAILQSFINAFLSSIPGRSKYLTIMDYLLLHSSKHSQLKYLKDFLKALLKSGLKISPNKCQLFRTELQYMDNTIFIKYKGICIKPLKIILEATQKLKSPITVGHLQRW